MSRARFSLASSQAEAIEKNVGRRHHRVRAAAGPPAEQHAGHHEAQVGQRLAGDASFGVAYSQVRSTA